ncbi:MAG: transposase [Deltaproteobacteria bacterium]|nr:transposase [Deltaproteobacteria bacterium]
MVYSDLTHLLISLMPKIYVIKLVQKLKWRTLHKLMIIFSELQKQYCGRHMWARGFFSCTNGNVTDQMVADYI